MSESAPIPQAPAFRVDTSSAGTHPSQPGHLRPWWVRLRLLALAAALSAPVCPHAAWAQDNAADTERLVRALEIQPGDTVAEIGAGGGALTLAMGRQVGPAGRVYSSELGDDRVKTLQQAVARANLPQITVLPSAPAATNLPDACCDAIFMRLVYHHFGDPDAMNASLLRSLEPGGRLAIIDFGPRGKEAGAPADRDEGDRHGVTPETVAAELKKAGFAILSIDRGSDREFMVVARKPE